MYFIVSNALYFVQLYGYLKLLWKLLIPTNTKSATSCINVSFYVDWASLRLQN